MAGLALTSSVPLLAGPLLSEPHKGFIITEGDQGTVLFDRAISQLGGIKRFLNGARRVVIKPSIARDLPPETGANTNPELVAHIIRQCYDAGAREVYVFDQTTDAWSKCYKNSGIERAAKDAFAKVLPANELLYYRRTPFPDAKVLNPVLIHELMLRADVFIHVPVASIAPNGQPILPVHQLSRCIWADDLAAVCRNNQALADLLLICKPALTVVDLSRVYCEYPAPPSTINKDMQIVSTDPVAAETATIELLGFDSNSYEHLRLAKQRGLGKRHI